MTSISSLASTAALLAEPARTSMLVALMAGRWLSAGELAKTAGVTPATTSAHLNKLLDGGLIRTYRQGRHRYFQLSGPDVALVIEKMMSMNVGIEALRSQRPIRTGPTDAKLRFARVCYDHLAGDLAVAIAERMEERGELKLNVDGAVLTNPGRVLLEELANWPGGDCAADLGFCQPCLDWSVRRPHIGGRAGRLMFNSFLEKGWIKRAPGTRVIAVTNKGQCEFKERFGIGLGRTGFA
jgi:DNA-binding transcriptional ArsR family regulator